MSQVAGAMMGGLAAAAYVPILRDQLRDGEVGIPFGTINPIRVRRDEHPMAFLLAAVGLSGLLAIILLACALVLVRTIA